ncbi:MAG: bifunctional nuclease domain-containing protein, partial [Bacteroidota bacterium]
MSKSALQIIAISESQSSDGQYVLVFEAEGSDKRITVNVGRSEARSIAIYLQQQSTKRPLTHDLLK